MGNSKLIYSTISALFILSLILGGIIFYSKESQKLKVIFLNVGQGDSILITQGNNQILIDGGKSEKVLLEKLGEYIPFWDRQIEVLVATHPDYDHIGGLIGVLKNYQVKTILETESRSNSKVFQSWKKQIEKEISQRVESFHGTIIKLPNSAVAEVLYPFSSVANINSKDKNKNSIVIKLSYGESDFLLTGDLPSHQEIEMIGAGIDLESEFLKVGHHGSKTSSSEKFLKAVSPDEVIISVGKNSYGHPSNEVIRRLKKIETEIFRTDEDGDIIYECEAEKSKCEII